MAVRQVDYSTRDYEGFRTDLINMLKDKIPEYSDFSQSDTGIVIIELLSHGLDILSYYNDVVANEIFLSTARERESVMKIVGMLGYTLGNATSSRFIQVFEIIPQLSEFRVPQGFKVQTRGSEAEPEVIFELTKDLTIPAGATGLEVDQYGAYLYTVEVVQGETVADEILGTSRGSADQQFVLSYTPVVVDSLQVFVNSGFGLETWNRVVSFIDSDTNTKDYMIGTTEQDELFVIFGNGISGMIPPPITNGITADYRVGGGAIGNVSANTIVEMPSRLGGVVRTFNPFSVAEEAIERESIEDAKRSAVASIRVLDRAVTLQDFKDLILTKPYVSRVGSFYNTVSKKVELYVLSTHEDGRLTVEEWAELNEFIEDRIMLGMSFIGYDAVHTPVNLTLAVTTYSDRTNAEVKTIVEGLLGNLFELGMIDLGEDVPLSSIIYQLNTLYDVKSLSISAPASDIVVEKNAVCVLGTLTVTVTGGV